MFLVAVNHQGMTPFHQSASLVYRLLRKIV